jgi:hypothetical protein
MSLHVLRRTVILTAVTPPTLAPANGSDRQPNLHSTSLTRHLTDSEKAGSVLGSNSVDSHPQRLWRMRLLNGLSLSKLIVEAPDSTGSGQARAELINELLFTLYRDRWTSVSFTKAGSTKEMVVASSPTEATSVRSPACSLVYVSRPGVSAPYVAHSAIRPSSQRKLTTTQAVPFLAREL